MENETEHQSEEVLAQSYKTVIPSTRKTIYIILLGCLLLPIICVTGYAASVGFKGIFVVAFLAASLSGGGGWYLLRIWEQKMQRSVNELVRRRMRKMHDFGTEPQSARVPNREAVYTAEIQRLEAELEKVSIGYEHQIDLMQSSVAKSKNDVHQLNLEMDRKLEEMRLAYLEFEDLRKEYHRLEEDVVHVKEKARESLKHKDSLINEYQRTMSEQRTIIEKKQHYISKLEGKVRDLMYEIRSLLQLEESPHDSVPQVDMNEQAMRDYYLPSSSQAHTPYDLSQQLGHYIEKAEELTGVDHLGYVGGKSPRFLDMSLECYAVDRRRLFDSFKDETTGILFIYSQVEKNFLFVNHYVKTLIGWSPEKFVKEFPRLVVRGYPEWGETLRNVKMKRESRLQLAILNKSGQPVGFECYLGMITRGPFANHVIGIFATLC